jgi:hypothetical protein
MISADLYKLSENEALSNDGMKTLQEIQRPIVFDDTGFKTQASHIFDLMDVVDSMQDNRFSSYMDELCGFSDEELNIFLSAANQLVSFQQYLFQTDKVVVPFDALISHFALFLKISGFRHFERVLEVGPGCGYLSIFMNGDLRNKYYCQMETTQIFYLLQSYLGSFLYGGDFLEKAHPGHLLAQGVSFKEGEHGATYDHRKKGSYMEHVPWWGMDNILEKKFDIITMNAMLCELSKDALGLYLDMAYKNIKDDGFFVVQCVGAAHEATGPAMPKSTGSEMLAAVLDKGFLIHLFLYDFKHERGRHTVENIVFLKRGHPLLTSDIQEQTDLPIHQEQNELFSTYYRQNDHVQRRKFSKEELMGLLKERYAHIA